MAERNILLQGGVGPPGLGALQLAHPMLVGVYVCMHACMGMYGMYGVGPHHPGIGASDDGGCVCMYAGEGVFVCVGGLVCVCVCVCIYMCV